MRIKDNIAVVAGGGSGLGAAVCHYLAEQGAKVVVIDLSKDAAAHVAKLTDGMAMSCDITQDQDLAETIEQIQHAYQRPLAIAINCAGITFAERMVSKKGIASLENFERVIKVNLVGTFNLMRLAAAQMMTSEPQEEGERGVIINTASIAAFEGQIGQTAYSASKGGVVAMTLPAARELAPFGIRVMTVAPGLADTPMLHGISVDGNL